MNRLRMFVCGLVSLGAAVASAGGLPLGYQQIPYIQADGKTAYVLTDYTPNPSTDKIVAEVSFPVVPTENLCVWCARSGTTSPVNTFSTFVLKHASDGNKLKFASHYGQQNNDEVFLWAVSEDTVYTVVTETNTCSILAAGETLASCTHPAETDFAATGGPMMLFASYNGNTNTRGNYGSFRLHSLQVYRNGAILYDIVPVRDTSKNLKLFNKTDNSINLPLTGTFTGDPWKSFFERLVASENVISAAEAAAATGGNIIWRIGNDYMHIFTDATEVQNFKPVVKDLNARILLVGGGGAGGTLRGGGGGAGGIVDTNNIALIFGTSYSVVVGTGGAITQGTGGRGGNSSVSNATEVVGCVALGGGGGGGFKETGAAGGSGGGGGGNGGSVDLPKLAGGDGTLEQGNNGGAGNSDWTGRASGGGGGGAGAVGADSTAVAVPGAGGDGRVSDILGQLELFAGGGGGGSIDVNTKAKGGAGGGGQGGYHSATAVTSTPGENGLGGGGGGGPGGLVSMQSSVPDGAAGGSGIVIIRYHYTAQGEKDKINVPQAKTGLVYDGTEKQGVADGVGYTLSGHLATAGGTHTATATLTDPDNSEWADDGSTAPKSITWSIAQAVNVWTVEAKLSKTSWMVEDDTPADLTVPVPKFGEVVATLNDEVWDGKTLPTEVGNYTSVWSVVETTDFTGLSVTKTFEILPVPPPENRVARYWNGTEWKGANSFADAVTGCPDGGIVEINQDLTFSSNATEINKSLTLRSCSARDVRYEMKATGDAQLVRVNAAGKTVVVSNLVVNGNSKNADFVYLTKGTLTLGCDLLLKKGGSNNGSLMGADAGTVINLDGVSVSNSSGIWGLLTFYNACTVNLYDCDIHGVGSASSNNRGSVLHMGNAASVLNVYGGTITGNVSQAGCGQVLCAGTVNFYGGKPLIEELKVSNATSIRLDGTLDAGASVGVMYGAAAGDQFGTYVSGDAASAQAFYLPKSADPELRGRKKVDKLVWKAFVQRGVVLIIR